MKKKTLDRVNMFILISIGIIVFLVAMVAIQYFRIWSKQHVQGNLKEQREYQYHCAFITSEFEDPFWDSVYAGAKAGGDSGNIYVEDYGKGLSLSYSMDDLIEMAIAAKVDAIMLHGNQTVATTELIDKAIGQGIVVVTVFKDDVNSKRCSFVGISNYTMGYNLCAKAARYIPTGQGEIMALFEGEDKTPEEIVTEGMMKYLKEHESEIKLNNQIINSDETYTAEEEIRALLRNAGTRPDVLICTTLIQTQCAYQAVVDLNCVGEVKIIGFYSTQSILEAVQKGVMQATYVVDTEEMGKRAIDSVKEYLENGYGSDYIQVKAKMIDENGAEELLEKMREEVKP